MGPGTHKKDQIEIVIKDQITVKDSPISVEVGIQNEAGRIVTVSRWRHDPGGPPIYEIHDWEKFKSSVHYSSTSWTVL